MALPSYPAGINYTPDAATWRALEPYRPPVWTEFEDGPAMARRNGVGRRARFAYRIVFTQVEHYEIFRAFVETTLYNGTLRFTMPVYVPGLKTYVTRECQLERGTYTADSFGQGFAVTFTLIVYDW